MKPTLCFKIPKSLVPSQKPGRYPQRFGFLSSYPRTVPGSDKNRPVGKKTHFSVAETDSIMTLGLCVRIGTLICREKPSWNKQNTPFGKFFPELHLEGHFIGAILRRAL
jgi:hypothetical protein